MTAKASEIVIRTYEVVTRGAIYRVDIPETWRVTFGPVIGAGGKSNGSEAVLRAWEGETKQRLLIPDVKSFRDLSVPMKRAAVRKYGSEEWFPDDGSWVGPKATEVEKGWLALDDISDKPLDDEGVEMNGPMTLHGMSPRANRKLALGER